MKQKVAKPGDNGKGGRPRNRLQIVVAYVVMDDFLRRDVEDRAEGKPRHRNEEREPQERRHRRKLLRLRWIPQELQGDNAAGAEHRSNQESPGKQRIDRGEEVRVFKDCYKFCLAKPWRSDALAAGFPPPENGRT